MTVSLIQTALELGLFGALTVLALYLSYTMLNVCDLSTDGCFTMGATVGAVVAISGHPFLSIPAAMAAGMASGFIVALLQTRMGIDSLLSGIIVNTAWYSVNIAVMGNASLLNMNKTDTVFTRLKDILDETVISDSYRLLIALAAVVLVVAFLFGSCIKRYSFHSIILLYLMIAVSVVLYTHSIMMWKIIQSTISDKVSDFQKEVQYGLLRKRKTRNKGTDHQKFLDDV